MSRRAPALLLLLPLAAACGRCGRAERGAPPGTVALVNGEPIPADALRAALELDRGGAAERPGPALRRRILDELIDRRLLVQEARARGLKVPPEEVERDFLRLRADYPGTHFDDLLAEERLSAAELRARLEEQELVERLLAQQLFRSIRISDEELRRWYDEHASEFDEPERVRARQVVLRTRDEALRVRAELRRRPNSFADVARRASIAPEGRVGGDLGYFAKGGGMPEVFDVCFKLPVNAISEVTPSPYGYHLFQVLERKPAGRKPFEEARGEIRERLLRERRSRAQEEYVAELRRKARITIDQRAVDALAPGTP